MFVSKPDVLLDAILVVAMEILPPHAFTGRFAGFVAAWKMRDVRCRFAMHHRMLPLCAFDPTGTDFTMLSGQSGMGKARCGVRAVQPDT